MVRFIMGIRFTDALYIYKFTFQYGQIYYKIGKIKNIGGKKIYIPIWLDLL